VSNGAQGRIAWVADESILPSLQHALIVDIGAESGVRPGDHVTIYGAQGAVMASAEVVRVEPTSTTVRVIHQTQAKLSAGLPVRVTEKLP
jgi:cell shape-determining protein MreC